MCGTTRRAQLSRTAAGTPVNWSMLKSAAYGKTDHRPEDRSDSRKLRSEIARRSSAAFLRICHKINGTHFRHHVEVSCSSNLHQICRTRFNIEFAEWGKPEALMGNYTA